MQHCPHCKAEFAIELPACSDCGGPLVAGPSPRFETGAPADPPPRDWVRIATVRGNDAASALADVLAEAEVHGGWAGGVEPVEDGDPEARFGLVVPPGDVERARAIITEWADPDAIEPENVPAPGPASPSPTPTAVASPAALPAFGLRHCPVCAAEFESERTVCADCGTALVAGPSPSFDPTTARAHEDGDDDEPLSPDDFVVLVTLRDGQSADALGGLLADAGIATAVAGSTGIRMHAPGHDPMGPLEAGTVDVGVFPEDLDRARELLATWPGKDAIIEDEEDADGPDQEDDAPAREPSAAPARAVRKAPQSTSPIGVVVLLAALVVLVLVWIMSRGR